MTLGRWSGAPTSPQSHCFMQLFPLVDSVPSLLYLATDQCSRQDLSDKCRAQLFGYLRPSGQKKESKKRGQIYLF